MGKLTFGINIRRALAAAPRAADMGMTDPAEAFRLYLWSLQNN